MIPRALRLLIWLKFRGTCRQLWRGLRTVKGKLIGGLILLGCLFMLFPVVMSLATPIEYKMEGSGWIQTYFPILLFAYFLTSFWTSLGTDSIAFSEEEVESLFPAPFTRRQLLAYKLFGIFRQSLIATLMMNVGFSVIVPIWLCGLIGGFTVLLFMSLMPLALSLIGLIGKAHAFNRSRKVIGFLFVSLLGWAAMQQMHEFPMKDFSLSGLNDWIDLVSKSTVGTILLAPFKVFSDVIFADALDIRFWSNLAIVIGINALLMFIIVRLDANYLEVVERSSIKLARIREKFKQGGTGTVKKEYTRTLPMLPFWYGMGPLIWRQLLITYRVTKAMLLTFGVIIIAAVAFIFFLDRPEEGTSFLERKEFPVLATIGLGYMNFIFSLSAPVGFRPETHRMEIFKCLPFKAVVIALGQLLGAVAILSLVNSAITLILACFAPKWTWIWMVVFCANVPVSYLFMALANIMSLWLPIKPSKGTTDMVSAGQGLLTMALIMFGLTLVGLSLFAVVATAQFFLGNWGVSAGIGILFGLIYCSIATYILVKAYDRFDVSMDAPVC